MAKRVAEKELTERIWDEEDKVEEMGTFSVASEEVMKNRAVKKAKRRNVGFESDSRGTFKGFKGLVVPSVGRGFSGFGGSGGKPLEGLTSGISTDNATPFSSVKTAAEPKAAFGSFAVNGPTTFVDKKISSPKCNSSNQPHSSGPASSTACTGNAYHKQLAGLNCSIWDWIVKHVNTSPLCDLTPIFKDYERYLQDSPFSFHGNKAEDTSEKVEFTAEKKSDAAQGATSASFSFGKKIESSVLGSLSSGSLTGFSFSAGNSSLFGKDAAQSKAASSPFFAKASESQAGGSSNECRDGDEEENDEPPKVVVTEVKEEDAFYSKKCKLFYKKANEFKEKGVGTLHLKPTATQKTQVLVRADTNLGNILLNVLIPPNMPCTQTGKNNVLIICQPTLPVTMLIWVKTSEDADELHMILLQKKDA
uniref:RanBD1 domain-containing protein n=1 Tax=Mus spicilegus TaxID=10103 RepID=A0A8C6G6F4_MUSSI